MYIIYYFLSLSLGLGVYVCVYVCVCVCVCSVVSISVTPWIVACQAPLSMEFFRQEYWSGVQFPSLGIIPTQGLNLHPLCLVHCKQILLLAEPLGKP